MKSLRSLLPMVVLLIAIFFAARSGGGTCGPAYTTNKTIQVGRNSLKVEVVTTLTQIGKGLGGRTCINPNQGMLFSFDKPGYYSMWMKDMRFPIDIVWLSSEKKVVYIKPDTKPSTYPQSFTSDQPAQYVLELKAGQTAKLGINKDTSLNF